MGSVLPLGRSRTSPRCTGHARLVPAARLLSPGGTLLYIMLIYFYYDSRSFGAFAVGA